MTSSESREQQGHPAVMFCRQCGYQLTGLSQLCCPECGQPFDPANRRTYLLHPKGWLLRRWLRCVVRALVGMVIVAVIGVGIALCATYQAWKAEQKVIAALCDKGAVVGYLPCHSWPFRMLFGYRHTHLVNTSRLVEDSRFPGLFGTRFAHVQDRAFVVWADRRGWSTIVPVPPLVDIRLAEVPLDDEALASLRSLKELKELHVASRRVTDTGLTSLTCLSELSNIYLRCPGATSVGIAHLRQAMPAAQVLNEPVRPPPPGPSPLETFDVPGFVPESSIAVPWEVPEKSKPSVGN